MQQVAIERSFDDWRRIARDLVAANIAPESIFWTDASQSTLLPPMQVAPTSSILRVPKQFMQLAKLVACHRDAQRWGLLYRMLWRLVWKEPNLLQNLVDDDVRQAVMMAKSVRRDRHKMTAFVRFRKVEEEGVDYFVAWHRPDHFIVRLSAPFFQDRFASMNWTILTPDDSVSWNGNELKFGPGVPKCEAPAGDDLEALWRTYYANIFNPARIKLRAMQKEMPRKHWPTLPETELISEMLQQAPQRLEAMMKAQSCPATSSAAEFIPERISLPQLRNAAVNCRGCDLYCNATQTVFGEGPARAKLMFVGEQPGDQEDLAGRPFVGPAGKLFDQMLEEAQIDRTQVYVTNAVKHFKFEQRGKRRIHSKPSAREVHACKPWLEAELELVKPQLVVALGATAAQALKGPAFRLTQHRGEFFGDQEWAPLFLATMHPSALLRIPDPAGREQGIADFVSDMKLVAQHLKSAHAHA